LYLPLSKGILNVLVNCIQGAESMENDLLYKILNRLDNFEERFDRIDARLGGFDERFAKIDERFISIDERFAKIDERFAKIDEQFVKIDERFAKVDERFVKVFEFLKKIDCRLDNLQSRQDEIYEIVRGLEENAGITRAELDKLNYNFAEVDGRLDKLSIIAEDHSSVIAQVRGIK